jgi:hypothetical protein
VTREGRGEEGRPEGGRGEGAQVARGWGREAASWLAELARWEARRGGPGVGWWMVDGLGGRPPEGRRRASASASGRLGAGQGGRRAGQSGQPDGGGWAGARARARSGDQLAEAVWAERQGVARAPVQGAIDRARAPVGTTGDPRARLVCRDQVAARAVL